MNFSYCDLERLEFQMKSTIPFVNFSCAGMYMFKLGCLVSDKNLEVLDIRETSFEIDMQKISKTSCSKSGSNDSF